MQIMIVQHWSAFRWITDYFGCNSAKIQVVMIDNVERSSYLSIVAPPDIGRLEHELATVDVDGLASDELAGLAGQEQTGRRHILAITGMLDRQPRQNLVGVDMGILL